MYLYGNDIDTKIEAIKKSSAKERFKLMNSFKKEIIKLKQKEQIEAILKLKTATKSKYNKQVIIELKEALKNNTNQAMRIRKEEQVQHETEAHIENFIEEPQERHHD
jgi:hypothetical protein